MDLSWHPYAEKFPMLEGPRWASFKESIRLSGGPEQPIVYRMVNGKKEGLDGRNRYRACQELGIEPPMKKVFMDDAQAIAYIGRHNVQRRHLTDQERDMLIKEGRAAGKSTRQIAEETGTSKSTVARVLTSGVPLGTPVTGKDGKVYKAPKKKPKTKPQVIHDADPAISYAISRIKEKDHTQDNWLRKLSSEQFETELVIAFRAGKDSRPAARKTARKVSEPPTLEEVIIFCQERVSKKKPSIDPEEFHAFYTANGWLQGDRGKPIVDWRAAVITWEKRKGMFTSNGRRALPGRPKANGEDLWATLDIKTKRLIWGRVKARDRDHSVNTTEGLDGLPLVRDSLLACFREMANGQLPSV